MDIGPLYASVYPAVQSFMVAARSLGIGTALTTVIRIHSDELRGVLGVPDGYEVAALVPMGRPGGPVRRRPAQAGRGRDPLGPLRQPSAASRPRPKPDRPAVAWQTGRALAPATETTQGDVDGDQHHGRPRPHPWHRAARPRRPALGRRPGDDLRPALRAGPAGGRRRWPAEGVGSQDRVAILDKNCPEYFELQYGAALLNAVLTPVNWRLAAARGRLHRQRRARPRCWPSGTSSCPCSTRSTAS